MAKIDRIVNLGSSSNGNSIYLEIHRNGFDKPFTLLLDCGFAYSTMLRKFSDNGLVMANLDACLVTHEHQDHAISTPHLIERNVNVFAPISVFDKMNIDSDDFFVIREYEWKEIDKNVSVMGIPLEHFDKDERIYNVGYILKIDDDLRILYVIDTKYLPQDLSSFAFDYIFIEANYLEDKVFYAFKDAQKKGDAGKIGRYKRLLDSHMSLENLARTFTGEVRQGAKPFNLSRCKAIFLTHLSSGYETNDSYYRVFLDTYLRKIMPREKMNDKIIISVCKRDGGFL